MTDDEGTDGAVVLHLQGARWRLADSERYPADRLEEAARADEVVVLEVVDETDGSSGVVVLRPSATWAVVTGPARRLRRDAPTTHPYA